MGSMPDEYRNRLSAIADQMDTITDLAVISPADEARFNALDNEFRELHRQGLRAGLTARYQSGQLGTENGAVGGPQTTREGRADIALRSSETIAQNLARRGEKTDPDHANLSFGGIIRGIATGDWNGFEDEQRAIAESPLSAGGHLVPVPVAANVIDRARNRAVVLQAGATIVPMTSATLKVPRLLTEPVPDWRLENGAIADKALTFDAVTLTAQCLACQVKCSWELLEDANPGPLVADVFAKAFALEIDRVALRGSGTAPEPRGVKNTSGVTVTAWGGANGATVSDYSYLLDAVATLRGSNFEPTAVITSPRSEASLAKLREGAGTGGYLAPPAALMNLPRFTTNSLPINSTTGTSNDTTEAYVADWSKLILGVRTSLRIRVLEERYADNGQVSFMADLRADVQLSQPSAFNVITGMRP